MSDASEQAIMRRGREEGARRLRYVFLRYAARDKRVARTPNRAGFVLTRPHDGGHYDELQFALVRAGWSHDHCFVCGLTITPGDPWWAVEPPDEIGLCPECHDRLFGGVPASACIADPQG